MQIRTRIIAVGIIRNQAGQVLLCQMASDHGVYPNQWGLVGGGIEEGETIEECLRREIREELGLEVETAVPFTFATDRATKHLRTGGSEEQYLFFLLFLVTAHGQVTLNDEWVAYEWVDPKTALDWDLNVKTREVLEQLLERQR